MNINEEQLTIRRAVPDDIPDVLGLLGQVLGVHAEGRPDLFKNGVTKYGEKELSEIFEDGNRPVFVAVKEGRVCGYAFCMLRCPGDDSVLRPVRTLYIDDLCVDAKHRGEKIGTRLFETVKEFAREKGCYNITLNVWSFNVNAMRFYESLGMKPQREYKEYIL